MNLIEKKLKGTTADKILDVGTETGKFLFDVTEFLDSYTMAFGIDINEKDLSEARKKIEDQPIKFIKADASLLPFSDSEFDLVLMNAVLHHLQNISAVLKESMRVLKPGGRFVLKEPYCDNQTERQQASIAAHHWFARVDRINGISNNSTFTRQEILDLVKDCGLRQFEVDDFVCGCDWKTNGKLEKEVEEMKAYLVELGDDPEYSVLRKEGEDIIKRFAEVVPSCATQLELVGVK